MNGLIGDLVQEFDPPVPQNTAIEDLLLALTFGLSLYAEGSVLTKGEFSAYEPSQVSLAHRDFGSRSVSVIR